MPKTRPAREGPDASGLALFACPNPECDSFNRFNAGNLSVAERMGKNQAIRRLYCRHCGQRFSERKGSLLEYTKLDDETLLRVVKCLAHGCSLEATADICEVDPRTAARVLARAGPRADDFHRLQLDQLARPPEAVELDELHARVSPARRPGKKGRRRDRPGMVGAIASWVESGFTRPWR